MAPSKIGEMALSTKSRASVCQERIRNDTVPDASVVSTSSPVLIFH
jgi:hypothetical protein